MSDSDRQNASSDQSTATINPGAVQRSAGKRTMVESRYPSAVQMHRAPVQAKGELDSEQVHAAADAGVAGGGERLPFLDVIQQSFGGHDVGGLQAHVGGAAAEANAAIGATAYAKGNDVAFASAPDLHTAAHEAAHSVQQRAGVQLKGGVGEAGDAYERHADAVADTVVRGESAEGLLSEMAGPAAAGGAVQQKALQKIGVPLNQDLPEGQAAPAFGEDKGQQRRWSPEQYIAQWEAEQGRKMTPQERQTIDRGCIGITAANIAGGGNPLDYAEGTWGDFEHAHKAMKEKNKLLDDAAGEGEIGPDRYIMFAKLFWSNQSEDWEERLKPDEDAFKADPKTGEVDMSGYEYRAQSRYKKDPKTGAQVKSSYVNFDYGFWDEASNCFWHANHMQYKDPVRAAQDPMIVLQSTREKFTKGYFDFDRIIFCIAKASNYDAGLAAITHAGGH
jgi:hypothetical protein